MQQSNARTPVTSSPSDDHELFVHQPPEFDTAGSWLSSILNNILGGGGSNRQSNLNPQLQNENPNFEDGDGDAAHNALVVGQAFSYQLNAGTFGDPEGETITFSIDGDLPPGLTFNAATRTISGTPRPFSDLSDLDADFEAAYIVNVIGTDPHGAKEIDPVTFRVKYPNQAPRVVSQLEDQELDVGDGLKLNLIEYMRDPEGSLLTFSVDNLPAGLSIIPNSFWLFGRPTEAFDDIVTITARDPSGLTKIMKFRLTVTSTEDMSIDRQLAGGAQSASWGVAMNPPYSSDNGEEHFPAQIEII